MISAIRHWLQPPAFPEDENKTRVAVTLNAILIIGAGGSLVYIIFILTIARGEIKSIAFSLFPILFMSVLWYLMRMGKVYIASVLLVCLAWLNLTVAAIVDGYGIRATSLYGYVLIVIVAGLLINWRASVIFALLNVASGLLFIYAKNAGFLPQRTVSQTDLTIWSASAVFSVSAAFILGIALRSLNDAIHRASLSESYYRMLFEEAPDGILIVDGSNQIIMANAAIYEMTGYAPGEVIGHSPLDFVTPDDLAARPPRPLDELKMPGSSRRERVLIHKDGSHLNVIISSSYMPDGQLQYIIQDITERKRIEAALQISEEKFAKSFQSSPYAITINAMDTGKFIEVNDSFCSMSGYARHEVLGRSAEELNIWEDVNQRKIMIATFLREGKVSDFETIFKRKGGEPLNCLLSVEAVKIGGENYMIVMARDTTERKQMEEELRLSEERYRLVSSVISDYIFSIILDEKGTLNLNWVGGAFERITGFTLEEFNERGGWLSILHPADREKDALDTANLMKNRRAVSEIRIIHKDGSIRWVRSYGHPVWDEEKNRLVGIYGAVQDITEQKRIEQELRLSEERYRLVSSVISDYIYSTVRDENNRWRQNWVAGAFERITGYSLEEFNNRGGWIAILHPNDLERDMEAMKKLLNNEPTVAETRIIHKDGSIHWVRSYAHPVWDEKQNRLVEIYGAVQDITEQKRIEQELLLSEERYRLVSSVISDYTFSNIQNEKGEIVLNWVAGAFEQISGYTFEEFNARGGWVSTVHPDDLEQDARDMEMLRRNQQVVSEVRTIHKDGRIRWVQSYAHPVWDEEKNELVGIYGAVQDITDRKRIEYEREKLIKDLEAKNQELEQFTYTVSHDLKAPLITIKGFLGFLAADARAGNTKRLEADIQRINEATDKMYALLTDLLELSRIGRLMNAPETVSFEQLVTEVIELSEGRLHERGINMIVKGELPNVYGDRQRLSEVVQNLIDNSGKFMGDQPHPFIEIGQHGEADNGFMTFFIRDNGIGIAPEFHDRIFGLFNRLNPKIEGTGIGLALVKRIIEFHGGRIWIQSEVGEGTTFFFTLPNPPH